MALIDHEVESKDKNNKPQEVVCRDCNKKLKDDSFILLCEDCFNKSIELTLNKIRENLIKMQEDLKYVENSIIQIKNLLNSKEEHHLMVINKLEIDLMNFEAVKKKILIDKELNEKAFSVNQIQANKVREQLKWSLFNLIELEDFKNEKK